MRAGDTLRVRGEGGAEFDLDVPEDGTERRSIFDAQIASGFLTVLGAPSAEQGGPAPTEPSPPTDDDTAEVAQAPAAGAPKAEWAAYAATLGLDPTGLTKASIVSAIGDLS